MESTTLIDSCVLMIDKNIQWERLLLMVFFNPVKRSSQKEFVIITAKRLPQSGTTLVSGRIDHFIPIPGKQEILIISQGTYARTYPFLF